MPHRHLYYHLEFTKLDLRNHRHSRFLSECNTTYLREVTYLREGSPQGNGQNCAGLDGE